MMVHDHGMYSIRTTWTDKNKIIDVARGGDVKGVDRLAVVRKSSLTQTTVPTIHDIKILYIVFSLRNILTHNHGLNRKKRKI